MFREEYRSFCRMGLDRLEPFFLVLFFSFRLFAVSRQRLEVCVLIVGPRSGSVAPLLALPVSQSYNWMMLPSRTIGPIA